MSFHGAREKFSKECIEFLSTVARDGTRQAPDEREEKQALQPQEHLNGHEEREVRKAGLLSKWRTHESNQG